jgi:hypothetical protein
VGRLQHKPGGRARVVRIGDAQAPATYDVRYVLGGRERGAPEWGFGPDGERRNILRRALDETEPRTAEGRQQPLSPHSAAALVREVTQLRRRNEHLEAGAATRGLAVTQARTAMADAAAAAAAAQATARAAAS